MEDVTSSNTVGTCPFCAAPVVSGTTFCEQCGKKLQPQPRSNRRGNLGRRLAETAHVNDLRNARLLLLIVGIFNLLYACYSYYALKEQVAILSRNPQMRINETALHTSYAVVIALFCVPVVFLVLWLWSKRNPFAACLTGLIVLVTLWLASAAINPLNLLSGIVMKALFIAAMLQGMRSALRYQRSHA
jgi:hypothetical protein